MINEVVKKFEQIKDLLGKQKDFSEKLNETIKTSLANIIATKTNYKNELVKIQDNIKYDIINNNENSENKNLMNQINDISSSITEFKNKVDSASNIYLNSNNNNICGEKNNDVCNMANNGNGNGNGNNIIEGESQNSTGNNRLKKLFSEINGGGFKF